MPGKSTRLWGLKNDPSHIHADPSIRPDEFIPNVLILAPKNLFLM